jgi:hypothetical protein
MKSSRIYLGLPGIGVPAPELRKERDGRNDQQSLGQIAITINAVLC